MTEKGEHNSQEEVPRCGFLSLPELGKARDASQGSVSRDRGCVNPPQRDRPPPPSLQTHPRASAARPLSLAEPNTQNFAPTLLPAPLGLKASGALLIDQGIQVFGGSTGLGQNLSSGTICRQERWETWTNTETCSLVKPLLLKWRDQGQTTYTSHQSEESSGREAPTAECGTPLR